MFISVTAGVTKLKAFYLATAPLLLSGQVRCLASFCLATKKKVFRANLFRELGGFFFPLDIKELALIIALIAVNLVSGFWISRSSHSRSPFVLRMFSDISLLWLISRCPPKTTCTHRRRFWEMTGPRVFETGSWCMILIGL